ncbi:MAG: hypothetical protein IT561_02020 [Alphaproteobacteria bacterium]|nr:hypothetical protein [Alphaproteobacteria bacterium]
MAARLVDLTVTEISLCRQGINPGARILLVKGIDAPPDPVAAAVAKAVAAREAEIIRLQAEGARAALVAKAAGFAPAGVVPEEYATHVAPLSPAARGWIDGILARAAAAVAAADLYGERGRAAVAKADSPIVRRARAARTS